MARNDMAIIIAFAGLLFSPATSSGAPPHVLSKYGDLVDPAGSPRSAEHAGIDFSATPGDPVLAAADGVVQVIFPDVEWCPNGIRLWHDEFDRFTHYCHLSDVKVRKYDRVTRGQVMGTLSSWRDRRGVPSKVAVLHFEVTDYARFRGEGSLAGTFDPMPLIVGCFDSATTYPKDRFVLTYPVLCRDTVPN